jgi:uncharacterized damage-inducible protein DinB
MALVDALLQELEQEAHATRRLLERVPNEQLDWRPHPKSYSLGQLALHVAQIPGGVATFVMTSPAAPPEFIQERVAHSADLVPALEESIKTAKTTLGSLSDARMHETWRLVDGDRELMAMPRIAFLRAIMLNHWYHHRGQLVVYLRQLNVPIPSVYGPTADENPFVQAGAVVG